MVNLPQGIPGWTVFLAGLILIVYRIRGIDQPRAWIEWVERQFAYQTNLRVIGSVVAIVSLLLAYFAGPVQGTIRVLFLVSWAILFVIGVGLAIVPNHVRLFVVATAEADDKVIKYVSIGLVVVGLVWSLLTFLI